MTSMNLISHRLYAAAARQSDRPQRKPARTALTSWPGASETRDLPFELVLDSKSTAPANFTRVRNLGNGQ